MIAEQTERSWLEEPAACQRGGGREAGGGKNTYVECTESGEQERRDAEGQASSHIGPGRPERQDCLLAGSLSLIYPSLTSYNVHRTVTIFHQTSRKSRAIAKGMSRMEPVRRDFTNVQLGNYRLTRLLGRGGFAEVYLGEHIHLSTLAAVKVLHTELTSDEREKFRVEARTIARLEHQHIVRVLDFGVLCRHFLNLGALL